MLEKYGHLRSCIVCDNDTFDGETILARKREQKKRIYSKLDSYTQDLLNEIALDKSLVQNDPFGIKNCMLSFISGLNSEKLPELVQEIRSFVAAIVIHMLRDLVLCFEGTSTIRDFDELSGLREAQPVLDSDDLIYIQDVISENIDRDIKVIRDEANDRNFKLMIGDSPLLNVERENMQLSTGEQNFISLAFELLLAKNSDKEYVVLDDPISSFDSVYKNKIAFCIVKFMENKRQIVLTHNLELVRLLEVQNNGCFNLYILNNHEGAKNGFIPVNEEEQKLLINLSDLISFFQNKGNHLINSIKNRRLFLISMIPFLRGYAHINLDPNDYYGKLSDVMHGYGTEAVDLIPIYNDMFGRIFEGEEVVTANDVLAIDCDGLDFFDANSYPLLAETLNLSLIYYYLRMLVEKKLMDIFHIPVQTGKILMLNQIIQRAFNARPEDPDFVNKRAHRVFFASRKTLLNEFNHFEGNINIFQPAIDITTVKLKKEVADIRRKIAEIEKDYSLYSQSCTR